MLSYSKGKRTHCAAATLSDDQRFSQHSPPDHRESLPLTHPPEDLSCCLLAKNPPRQLATQSPTQQPGYRDQQPSPVSTTHHISHPRAARTAQKLACSPRYRCHPSSGPPSHSSAQSGDDHCDLLDTQWPRRPCACRPTCPAIGSPGLATLSPHTHTPAWTVPAHSRHCTHADFSWPAQCPPVQSCEHPCVCFVSLRLPGN